jgi:hypothetical protein
VPGKELLRTIIDPYPVSFGYVSTHVLAPSASAKDLTAGLKAARTYVAFDWLADPTGAAFVAESGRWRWTIGDTIETRGPLKLRVELPQKATIRAVRDGITIASEHGHSLALTVDRPGAYRFEAELRVGGEPRPWIYTGAIRVVRPPDARVRVRATTRNKGR